MNDSPLKSVPQCYHWNHLKTHSYNGNVVSTTLEYNYINELQITRQRRPEIYSNILSPVPVTGN